MKLKKIFVVAALLLVVFLIYLTTMDKKIYYLALGDAIAMGENINYPDQIQKYLAENDLLEQYRNEFIEDDLRITDLIHNIEDNKKVEKDKKEYTLKNVLIKADLVTLSIGNEELFYKMKTEKQESLYNYIDEMMTDMETLFQLMKEYCKEDIFVLGYVNPFSNDMNRYVQYANEKLETLSKKYDMHYVSLKMLTKEELTMFGINDKGNQKLSDLLIPLIKKHVFQD